MNTEKDQNKALNKTDVSGSFRDKFKQINGYDVYAYFQDRSMHNPEIIGFCENYVEYLENILNLSLKSKLIVNGFEIRQNKNADGNYLHPQFLQWEAKHLITDEIFYGQNKKECINWAENYR